MQVKNMTLQQLKNIINNNYLGDPSRGYGFDYVDYADEIKLRYWELMQKKADQEFNDRLKQLELYEKQ